MGEWGGGQCYLMSAKDSLWDSRAFGVRKPCLRLLALLLGAKAGAWLQHSKAGLIALSSAFWVDPGRGKGENLFC